MNLQNSYPKAVRVFVLLPLAAWLVVFTAVPVKADIIELVNGDHYRGTVLALTTTNVEFLSEVQGRVKLPRDKIAKITFREVAAKPGEKPATPVTNAPLILSGADSGNAVQSSSQSTSTPQSTVVIQQMRQQGVDPKLVDQVQQQIFGKGNPQAAQQFNDMVSGLMSGSISVKDVRAQAQNSIAQIKAAEKDMPEASEMLDSYLQILQKFVNESSSDTTVTAPPTAPTTPARN
jgi:hypothetical protein